MTGLEDIVKEHIKHGADVNDMNYDGKFLGFREKSALNIFLIFLKNMME